MPGAPRKKPQTLTKEQRARLEAAEAKLREEVGERIVLIRMALGLTQAEWARRIDIPKPVLSQQENGLYLPSIQYALRMDEVSGCTLDFLYKGKMNGVPTDLAARMNRIPKGMKKPPR